MNDYTPRAGLDTVCAALAGICGVSAPAQAAPANEALLGYAAGRRADRLFMYDPDAVAQWIWDRYPSLFGEVRRLPLQLPLTSVMPSVTPVCFATLYTGALPRVHGITKYEKPVVQTPSLFDAFIAAGKRCAIVADTDSSMSRLWLEKDMDYYVYDTLSEVNARAMELICRDEHDFIAVYNGNYDALMHKTGPESLEALAEARANSAVFGEFVSLIRSRWQGHDTLAGFAMDHGCHLIDAGCGSHGLDMPEDMDIVHSYEFIERKL
ncbi:MAG: hypothetical protein IK083_06540 [Abditibacteriota bacterium]|nr:hypothetical protein [Abditibacteriota bacterium]